MHLLASLPETYNILLTALNAKVDVSKMEVVTECLLHEERKLKDIAGISRVSEKTMVIKPRPMRKGLSHRCHYSGKFEHIETVMNWPTLKGSSTLVRSKERTS